MGIDSKLMIINKNKGLEITVSKLIEDLKGIDDTLYDPRALSPEDLKEACNNLKFTTSMGLTNAREDFGFELVLLNYLFRKFFFLQHQTGLYNPQRKLWSHLAQTIKVKVKDYKRIGKKDKAKNKITDFILEDASAKFIKVRAVHPGADLSAPGFKNLISNVSSKCVGLFYISEEDFDTKNIALIKERTNAEDFYDKYKSPITKNCSFNLIKYQVTSEGYSFNLIYPNLGRDLTVTLKTKDLVE